MHYLKTLDYILFILLMVGGIWGAIKGFLDELSSKFGLVFGFLMALMFTNALRPVFQDRLGFPTWFAAFLVYFLIFIVGYLLVRLLGSILTRIIDTANISVIDNILGFFLGLVEAFCLIAAFEFILGYQNLFNLENVFKESLFSSKLINPFINFCIKVFNMFA